ncbi:MAG: site-specific integrase [Cyanobacteria bacterium P01_F01_bin.86]
MGSSNRKEAAKRAAEISTYLLAHGWPATLRKFKKGGAAKATVGQVIEASLSLSSARASSLSTYAKALRKIVSEIAKIPDARKFDGLSGGADAWRKRVDAVKFAEVTPDRVNAWKQYRIKRHGKDVKAKRKEIVTTNSLIRNAKALFAKKILPFLHESVELPENLPFDGVSLEKSPSMRYHSKIDAAKLMGKADEELATSDTEAYKVFLLSLVCGLRRSEIDNLLWRNFDFDNQLLRVETTEYHQLKSEDSAGEIDLDEKLTAHFAEARFLDSEGEFVVRSQYAPTRERKSRSYRCEAVFNRLNKWLKENGVDAAKPTHTLRKEIGSVIASQYGIFEASRYLRHSDIRITSTFYADKKRRVIPSLK